MISIDEFTSQLAAEFEDIDPNTITPSTNYREIKNFIFESKIICFFCRFSRLNIRNSAKAAKIHMLRIDI